METGARDLDAKRRVPFMPTAIPRLAYESMGDVNVTQMCDNGVTVKDHTDRQLYALEYAICDVCKGFPYIPGVQVKQPDGSPRNPGFVFILDMTGFDLSAASSPWFFAKIAFLDLVRKHYPYAIKQTLVVGASVVPLFRLFFRNLMKGFEHVHVASVADSTKLLRQYIDVYQIPREFAGRSQFKLGDHPMQRQLKYFKTIRR